jgi:hypothetical protein
MEEVEHLHAIGQRALQERPVVVDSVGDLDHAQRRALGHCQRSPETAEI